MKFESLPAIVRVLLTSDGTVTRCLKAYFAEEISVIVAAQQDINLQAGDAVLNLNDGQSVLRRKVKLVGQSSKRVYAVADTSIALNRLPAGLLASLNRGDIGVGELLQVKGLETFREIIAQALVYADLTQLLATIEAGAEGKFGQECAWRHYSISHAGQCVMHIQEYFPLSEYSEVE